MPERVRPAAAAALVLAAASLALFVLARRFDKGDSYPPYSTWRHDPLGCGALYEALPAAGVETRRLTRFEPDPAAGLPDPADGAVLRLGDWPGLRGRFADYDALSAFARQGGLLILAFQGDAQGLQRIRSGADLDEPEEDDDGGENGVSPTAQAASPTAQAASPTASAAVLPAGARDWMPGIELRQDGPFLRWAEREPGVDGPDRIPLRSGRWLEIREPWRALYGSSGRAVAAERRYGAGRVIMLADVFPLSNQGLGVQAPGALLAPWLAGRRTAVFDERPLGVADQPGLGELLWRQGLGPALGVLVLLSLLWLWRQGLPLVPGREPLPPPPASAASQLGPLLRGQSAPAELLKRLWAEAEAQPQPRARLARARADYEAWLAAGARSADAGRVYDRITRTLTERTPHGRGH